MDCWALLGNCSSKPHFSALSHALEHGPGELIRAYLTVKGCLLSYTHTHMLYSEEECKRGKIQSGSVI